MEWSRFLLPLVVVFLFRGVLSGQFYIFSKRKVGFMDQVGKNFLWRGCYPGGLTPDTQERFFDFEILNKTLFEIAEEENMTLPSDYYFVDLTLIFKEWNVAEYKLEKEYWDKHSDLGELVYFPLVGCPVNASEFSEKERKVLVHEYDKWDYDKLTQRTDKVRGFLEKDYGKPAIIYMHCSAGSDRTGEICGSYYIKYQQMTQPQALTIDAHYKGHVIETQYQKMLNWYCYYLQYEEKILDRDCDNWNYNQTGK